MTMQFAILQTERADIGHQRRYINPARHVRAFGVRMGFWK
jgi:hypothetical protein